MARNEKRLQEAIALHTSGKVEEAVAAYRQLLRQNPNDALVLDYLAQGLQIECRLEEALYARRQAVRLEPENLFLRDHLASLLIDMGEPDQSVEVWRDLVARSSAANSAVQSTAEIRLARQMAEARRVPEAIERLRQMATRWPGDSRVIMECAAMHERMGDADAARRYAESVLASDAEHVDANTMLARLEAAAGQSEAARARLERILARPESASSGRIHAMLAQVLDKLREYDAAFAHASIAQRAQFDAMPLQHKNLDIHEVIPAEALKLTGDQIAAWPRPAEGLELPVGVPAAPVFVVGFPRSGTTLIEQMFSAHPNLAVSDELPVLQAIRQKIYADVRKGGRYPADLGSFTARQVTDGRRWYLERMYRAVPEAGGKLDGGARKRIVDKHPLNTVEMCFARLLFPDSPIIYVQRDPRDTLISVFMQGFSQAVPHLFSLEGSARLYHLFAQTWAHYEKVLGMRTMRLRYEDLVEDPEREARRMIEFIGEPWSQAVLNYYAPEHRRFVVTPSYADVSKPVYKRARGRWRNYETHLAPILPVLRPWIEAGGYDPE